MMRPKVFASARRLPAAWLLCAILVALAAACSGEAPVEGAAGAHGRGIYVGSEWQSARTVSGHEAHVVNEKIACSKCHALTSDSIGKVTPSRCAECHKKESKIEHAAEQAQKRFGGAAKSDCNVCHAFTLTGTGHVFAADDCNHCHNKKQGDTPAVRVHHEAACVKCHKPHDDQKPKPAPCADCHKEITATHVIQGRSPTANCSSCHQNLHAPAEDSRPTCVACHSKDKPKVSAKTALFEGHTECVGCHRPHEFAKADAVSCRSCHEDIAVLGGARVRAHNQCTSCHAPHDVKGSPDRACAACHREKHPDHPRHGVAGTCVGCHDPHPPSARLSTRARNCSSCHHAAAADTSFHGGTSCKKCHVPHDFVRPVSDRSACDDCHGKQVALSAPIKAHQRCEGCHTGLPHRPAALRSGCGSCHADEQREMHRGHSNCQSCHEPHGGTLAKGCQSCHKAEHQTAPAGHRDCQKCHQPHSGSTTKASCTSCHAAEARTPHAAVKGGCNTCHRAHGPGGTAKAPACASCHQTASLPGLHQVSKHQACNRCHTGHGQQTQGAERPGCLSCHQNRKNHFPDAARCTGCHLFEKTR